MPIRAVDDRPVGILILQVAHVQRSEDARCRPGRQHGAVDGRHALRDRTRRGRTTASWRSRRRSKAARSRPAPRRLHGSRSVIRMPNTSIWLASRMRNTVTRPETIREQPPTTSDRRRCTTNSRRSAWRRSWRGPRVRRRDPKSAHTSCRSDDWKLITAMPAEMLKKNTSHMITNSGDVRQSRNGTSGFRRRQQPRPVRSPAAGR